MIVERIACVKESDHTRVVIETDCYPPLYFLYNRTIPQTNLGELALMVLLVPAMTRKEPLTLPTEYPICPVLLSNLEQFQEVFCQWFPELEKVAILATEKLAPTPPLIQGISSFSGGVDSLYTFFEARSHIYHIMLCSGVDLHLSETKRIEESKSQCAFFAAHNAIPLLVVETNIRDALSDYDVVKMHGLVFVGIMLALNPQRIFVPASNTLANLFPWGTHPLTDPLMSTASNQVIHHGAIRRSSKIRALAENQNAVDMLRVCNASDQYNCSECEKCLRTMFVLKVLGKNSSALKEITEKQLKTLRLYSEAQATHWRDNSALAFELGDTRMHALAAGVVRRFTLKASVKMLLAALGA